MGEAARTRAELPQAERKRRAILDAVLRVVAEGGVDAVTHRRVAAEAEVPLGSTTYYFASREDLLREAFRQHAGAVYGSLDALADELPLRSADDLVGFLVELVRRELAEPAGIVVEYELIVRAARDLELAREVNAYERNLTARLAESLERLGVAHALEAARTLIALVRGFELERLTRPSVELADLRRRLRVVVGALTPSRRSA
ncbi:MAG: TetR family transcriptional regulator [Thermodesulfobacteriota bacterium]